MRRYRDEPIASVQIETVEALEDRLVTLRLTRDEATTLMYLLEAAADTARLDALFAMKPTYPPRHPADQRNYERAANDHLNRVTDLCEQITDIWRESR